MSETAPPARPTACVRNAEGEHQKLAQVSRGDEEGDARQRASSDLVSRVHKIIDPCYSSLAQRLHRKKGGEHE